jgi:hypothetical protein
MSFTALTTAQTAAKAPIDQALMDLIRTNFDDLNTRVATGASTIFDSTVTSDRSLQAFLIGASTLPS